MKRKPVRIAGAQGFYGDSPMAALAIAKESGADYLVHDALAELTLSILQKDKLKNPDLGFARDILLLAKLVMPIAFKNGMKIVTNSGGLNPESAAKQVAAVLKKMGVTGIKIATITGGDMLGQLDDLKEKGLTLANLDTQEPYTKAFPPTHANVYIGAKSVAEALANGADLILAGRVADPCLTLGILAHHYGWKLDGELTQDDLDKLASGITAGHVIECGGQASGGNSYAEWPMDYPISNLGYPIAHVYEDGTTEFTKLASQGGKVSRQTVREQLVYEIHDPANYITPDVTVDLTQIKLEDIGENLVRLSGVKGKPRPEKLKLAIGQHEGFLTEQFFFASWPYAYKKARRFVDAVQEIWKRSRVKVDKANFSYIGINAMHQEAIELPDPDDESLANINEIGIRLALKHQDPRAGKMAIQSIVCLGLNGPPGVISMPGWGKMNRVQLSLWPTLIPREFVQEQLRYIEI